MARGEREREDLGELEDLEHPLARSAAGDYLQLRVLASALLDGVEHDMHATAVKKGEPAQVENQDRRGSV